MRTPIPTAGAQSAPRPGAFKYWLLATRPKTLVATLVPVVCGTALGRLDNPSHSRFTSGDLHWAYLVWALLSTLCLQIATNFINDAVDHKKGSDGHQRLGPTRVSSAGLINAEHVYRAGLIFLALAFLFGLPLVQAHGWPILLIGICSIVASYSYTGGPFPLAYNGLGDVFVLVFFGWVAVGGSYFLQTGTWGFAPLVLGTQLGLLATALIAINNLRDIVEDTSNRKRTFASMFGKTAARIEITAALMVPFLLLAFWIKNYGQVFVLPIIAIPIALAVSGKVWRIEPARVYNTYLAQTALVNLLFAIGFVTAVAVAVGRIAL